MKPSFSNPSNMEKKFLKKPKQTFPLKYNMNSNTSKYGENKMSIKSVY